MKSTPWIAKTVERWGKLDGAANVAGVLGKEIMIDDVESIDSEDWAFVLGVNLTGVTLSQIPDMKSSVSGVDLRKWIGENDG